MKLDVAPRLAESVETEDPRGGLEQAFADARGEVDDDELAAYDDLAERADDVLVTGVNDGFRTAFLVAGLALLAAAPWHGCARARASRRVAAQYWRRAPARRRRRSAPGRRRPHRCRRLCALAANGPARTRRDRRPV